MVNARDIKYICTLKIHPWYTRYYRTGIVYMFQQFPGILRLKNISYAFKAHPSVQDGHGSDASYEHTFILPVMTLYKPTIPVVF